MKSHYTLISMFAGISGSSLGFYNTGRINELLVIDSDPYVEKCFKLNFPSIQYTRLKIGSELLSDDILKLTNLTKGELDILFASPPCQGFSMARGLRNIDDPRNNLLLQTIQYIDNISPKVFIIENVKGLITGKMKYKFNQIIEQLEKINYDYAYKTLNAANYQVPQLRQRIFLIGVRKDITSINKNIKPIFPNPIVTNIKNLAIKNYVDEEIDFFTNGQFDKNKFSKDKICRTITATSSMRFYKNGKKRKPSISEIKKLCSFPIDYKLWSNKTGLDKNGYEYHYNQKYHGIGNSVPPKLMEAVARTVIRDILDKI